MAFIVCEVLVSKLTTTSFIEILKLTLTPNPKTNFKKFTKSIKALEFIFKCSEEKKATCHFGKLVPSMGIGYEVGQFGTLVVGNKCLPVRATTPFDLGI